MAEQKLFPARAFTQADLPTNIRERFESKVEFCPTTGCWLWIGGMNETGYGIMGIGPQKACRIVKAHRVSWVMHKGDLEARSCILHRCDTPACVNPDHLWLGTMRDNSQDMSRKNRHRMPDNRGERATWAKLTADAVAHVLKREMRGTDYARLYGCSKSAIYQIWRGDSWKSVERGPG